MRKNGIITGLCVLAVLQRLVIYKQEKQVEELIEVGRKSLDNQDKLYDLCTKQERFIDKIMVILSEKNK